jgi:hypothetical protein
MRAILMAAAVVLLAAPAQAQDRNLADDPAGWTAHQPDGSRRLILDLNADGRPDQAEPVVHKAKDLYSVLIRFGGQATPPVLLFERYLIPDLDIQLTRLGADLGVVASKDGPMDVYRWTGQRFTLVGADRLLPAPFPDYPLHPRFVYPVGWTPYPVDASFLGRSAMLPLDEDSQWDEVQVVLNASRDRYGVMVWLTRGRNIGVYDNPMLVLDRPLTPGADVRLEKGLRTFTVHPSKDATPEHFAWDGKAIVPVQK